MDYSNSTGAKIMAPIAQKHGCTFQPFSQMVLLKAAEGKTGGPLVDGANGICHGLAVAWLESMKRGDGEFIGEVSDLQNSALFYRAYMAYRHQETYGMISTSGSFQQGAQRDYAKRGEFFGKKAIEQTKALKDTGKEKEFGANSGGMRSFVEWLMAATGKRYFLLHVPKHAMAAVGSKFGTCHFFDPNCGIVSSSSSKALAGCLTEFFSNDKIKTVYQNNGAPDWMTVEKFKGI